MNYTGKSKSKLRPFPWWERIIFAFLPKYAAWDEGTLGADKTVVIIFKRWRGVTYIVEEYVFDGTKNN